MEATVSYALACFLRSRAWKTAHQEVAKEKPSETAVLLEEFRLDMVSEALDEEPEELLKAVEEAATAGARGSRPSTQSVSTQMALELGLFWWHLIHGNGHLQAWKHLTTALQHFHRLHWRPAPWRGANLGGWFLLEPGPASPFFDSCHARVRELQSQPEETVQESRENPPGMDDEHGLCEALHLAGGPELRRAMFEAHRASHYAAATMTQIRDCGLNAVRLPLGYWVVQEPGDGEVFEGPCWEALDAAIELVQASGLQLLLDLHGAPGGENGERPCGRKDKGWNWQKWRMEEAVRILASLAARYCQKSSVTGLQVCNEPAESIPAGRLCDFYQEAIEVIRANGMGADRVAIVLPIFTHWRVKEITQTWRERGNFLKYDNVACDLHYYHNFSSIWNLLSHQQHVDVVRSHALELKSLPGAVVGEWSISRPGRFTDDDQADFAQKQVLAYNHASHGWFFWNWHDHDFYPEWDLERGVFQSGKLPKPLGPELQGFLHPEWEAEGSQLPSGVSGLWPRLMEMAGAAQELMQQIWPRWS